MDQRDPRLTKGFMTYGNPQLRGTLSRVVTGKFCSLSDLAVFDCGAQHNLRGATTYPLSQKLTFPLGQEEEFKNLHPRTKGDILLGHDVWVAEGAFVMGGVSIGTGAVIGAGTVVREDVLPYQIYTGPVEPPRFRCSWEQQLFLQKLAWWDRPLEWIAAHAAVLMGSDWDAIFKLA